MEFIKAVLNLCQNPLGLLIVLFTIASITIGIIKLIKR